MYTQNSCIVTLKMQDFNDHLTLYALYKSDLKEDLEYKTKY